MSRIIQTFQYIFVVDQLMNGEYAVGDSVYLEINTFKITNESSTAAGDIGPIGVVQEAPDLTALPSSAPPRMVVRLTVPDSLLESIKRTLNSSDL